MAGHRHDRPRLQGHSDHQSGVAGRHSLAPHSHLVDTLGGPDGVAVVFTARNLISQVTSAWQEELKIGTGQGMEEFTAALDDSAAKWNGR